MNTYEHHLREAARHLREAERAVQDLARARETVEGLLTNEAEQQPSQEQRQRFTIDMI